MIVGLSKGMEDFRLRRQTRRSLLFVALVVAPLSAGAQADTARADSARRLRPITIRATRAPAVVSGASSVVLQPAEVRASPAPLLEQALRESPLVHVRQNSRGEMELSIRGSDSRQAAVLLDGVPLTIGWDHRTDPAVIPITGSDRLVIVPGLGSLLNGPNTLGGTIEVSHDPLLQKRRLTGGFGVDEHGSVVGTFGGGSRIAELGGGAVSLRGGLAYRQRDGLSLAGGALDPTSVDGLRTNTDLRETDGFASLRWSNDIGRTIGFTVSAMDAEKGVPPEEHISAPRLWRYPYHRRVIAALSASTGTFSTPFGHGAFDVGAGYNGGKLKIESYSARDYATITGEELGDERSTTARVVFRHSLGPATMRAGFTSAEVKYEETLSPAAPVNYRQTLRSSGFEVESPLGDRTIVAAGFVLDRVAAPETGGRDTSKSPLDNTGWRAGMSRDLDERWKVHASASRRSRFPSLRELYSGALNRFTPNPDLRPETLVGLEGGVTMVGSLGSIPQATLGFTAFRHRLHDAVIRITLSNPTRFMRVNRDRIESSGLEILTGLVLSQDRERPVTLNVDATLQNISIFDQTANDAVRHAENNPETRGRAELGFPLPWQMRGSATARHTGTQYCLNGETGNEMTLPKKTSGDLAAERMFTLRGGGDLFRWLRAVVSLDNVGNVAVYDQCGLPQPGRTLRLMMTIG
jgi:iron complex outermembrane recepter protein